MPKHNNATINQKILKGKSEYLTANPARTSFQKDMCGFV